MFGNNSKDSKKKNGSNGRSPANNRPGGNGPASGGVNTIDENTTIKGDLEAGGDIRTDGKLIGNLVCQAKLIIGPRGHIDGDVECLNAVVEGSFEGNLLVRDMLNLRETAKLTGDIRAKKMAVAAGCTINGTCTVTGDAEPQPAAKANGKQNGKANGNPLKQRENATAKA